ncbi:beta-N-acetylhexosaminidase [Bacteroides acidifaciens]|uniref:beta-N-acetylhexosaminidase n=1 Tax=Bacteroides acidifaciens TaxID=85831 RepID=A0A3L8AG56_9BACE|nr:beta-N-acetylhexosaminidase [Bacteroides acidifaciens]RLT81603.1 beta-N-acetylhexosaminidase [Bacteroides acidifaciens]
MKKLIAISVISVVIAVCDTSERVEADYGNVIPLPHEIVMVDGNSFVVEKDTRILYPENNVLLERNAQFLAKYIEEATGRRLKVEPGQGGNEENVIILGLDASIDNPEGYELTVSSDRVTIKGQAANGVFYGLQTLRKSVPAIAYGSDIILPAAVIKDAPRFAYRGMMLDVGRHFFSVDFVKRYIDLLAMHNMNYFHWHLTEDQGWRIEIKKYPRLTEIGSIRKKTGIGSSRTEFDGKPYGGFYTQDEIKEIVKYAQEQYVTVIPEIDLPGHMLAALAAYPELGCTGGPYEVACHWGVFSDVLCIGNEKTYEFLEGVLAEVIELFPSKYIHIGGDEAPRTRWETCPKCQMLAKKEGLKPDREHSTEDRLQSYCMKRIERYLNEKGRQIIGWDEILEGDVAPNATVMSWRGIQGGIKAAKLKHDVIMTPNDYMYFDYYQSADKEQEPLAMGSGVTVEKVYGFEPVVTELENEEKKHILGVQANMWTEYIATPEHVEYMMVPRMAALAEVQWMMPEEKDYQEFLKRLNSLVGFYKRESVNYAKHVF